MRRFEEKIKSLVYDSYKEKGDELLTKCPFRGEKTPSFYINMESGVYHCFGCGESGNIIDFVSKLEGISKAEAKEQLHIEEELEIDTTSEQSPLYEYSILKQLPQDFLESLGIREGYNNEIKIPYFNENKECIAIRDRALPKEFWWEKGSKVNFYGLNNLKNYKDDYIIVVEGESDTQTLWFKNIQTIGIPGANLVKTVFKRSPNALDKFKKIYVHRDNDTGAGKNFVTNVAKELYPKEVLEINSEILGGKDPSELFVNGMLDFERLIGTAEKVELPEETSQKSNNDIKIKGNLPLHVIAENITSEKNIKFCKNLLYVYDNGVYIINDGYIEKAIYDFDKELKKHARTEVLEYSKLIARVPAIYRDDNIINFRNGLYDIEKGQLLEHNPNLFLVNQVNCNYIANAQRNEFVEKFLDDITSGNKERKKAILQIIGYTCTTNMDIQKAFIFVGKGNNGKSVLVELISKLIGSDNISHVTIHDLQNGKFYAAELSNKLLNIVAELSRNHLKSVEVFKSMVTGDEISAERKYQDRFDMKPYAKNIFTANELPRVEDVTERIL